MSRLETWLDAEVTSFRSWYPELTVEAEREYREALSGTLQGGLLQLRDSFDELVRAILTAVRTENPRRPW